MGAERPPTSQARLVPWHILTLGFWNIPFGLGRQIQACRAQSPSESIRVKSLPNKVGANKREWVAVNRCMLEGIRIEVEGPSDLPRMQDWLSRHRGQTLELDRARQLEFGVPISAARAVLVAVTLQDGDPTTTQLGGVVRAIANRSLAEPVRLSSKAARRLICSPKTPRPPRLSCWTRSLVWLLRTSRSPKSPSVREHPHDGRMPAAGVPPIWRVGKTAFTRSS